MHESTKREALALLQRLFQHQQESLRIINNSTHRDHVYDEAGHVIIAFDRDLHRLHALLHGSSRVALRVQDPADIFGYRTLVRQDDDVSEGVSDQDRTKERALPAPSEHRQQSEPRLPVNPSNPSSVGTPAFNKLPSGYGFPQVRTLSKPGDQYEVQVNQSPLIKRRAMAAAIREELCKRRGGGR